MKRISNTESNNTFRFSIKDVLPSRVVKNAARNSTQSSFGLWSFKSISQESSLNSNAINNLSSQQQSFSLPEMRVVDVDERIRSITTQARPENFYRDLLVTCPGCGNHNEFSTVLRELQYNNHSVNSFNFEALSGIEGVEHIITQDEEDGDPSVLLDDLFNFAQRQSSDYTIFISSYLDYCEDSESYSNDDGIDIICNNCSYRYFYRGCFDYD